MEEAVVYFDFLPNIRLEELRRNTENFNQDSRSPQRIAFGRSSSTVIS
jgi:hypothetical protein